MEVKEAIEFIRLCRMEDIGISKEDYNEVISLLQQGENDRIELADENQMLKNHIEDLKEGGK